MILPDFPQRSNGAQVEWGSESEVSPLCYELVEYVTGQKPGFMSNYASVRHFHSGDPNMEPPGLREKWFRKVEERYGVDISDMEGVDLRICDIARTIEQGLEWQRLGEQD